MQFLADELPCQVSKKIKLNNKTQNMNSPPLFQDLFPDWLQVKAERWPRHRLCFEGWVCSWQVLKPIFKSIVGMRENRDEGEREGCWEGWAVWAKKRLCTQIRFFSWGNGRWGKREGGRERFYSSFKVIEEKKNQKETKNPPDLKDVKPKYKKDFKKTKYW